MRALVTGAGGFLGQYVAEQLLARGDTVRSLSRQNYPALHSLGIEQVAGDLRDAAVVQRACQGMDVVFHTAAVAGIGGAWSHYYGINTLGTQNVIEACFRQNVRKLIFSSSPSVTFAGVDQLGIDESAPYPTRWLGHYPHTKALAEQAVLAANGQHDLLTCALRPHLIWGPRDQHLVPRLIERARQGQLRRVGNGQNLIDTVYVENAAAAHLLAEVALQPNQPPCGRAYFISQGEPVNCWDWIDQLLALAGLPPVKKSVSFPVAYGLGGLLEFSAWVTRQTAEPRMTRFLAAQLATSHYFDLSRARADLAYTPQISLDIGMQRLAESWQR